MKRSAIFVSVAWLLSSGIPALAQTAAQERAICNIAAKSCLNKAELLKKRIKQLRAEISKGNSSYSTEELKKLEEKLKDVQDQLDKMDSKIPTKDLSR